MKSTEFMGSAKDQHQRRGFSKTLQQGFTNSMKYSMRVSVSELNVFPVWSYVSEMAGVSAAPKSPESSCGLKWKYQRMYLGEQLQMRPDMVCSILSISVPVSNKTLSSGVARQNGKCDQAT